MAAPTYPLSLPSSPAFTTSSWRLERRTALSQSPFTGNQQVAEFDYALWTAELNLPPMKRATAAAWQAFILQLHGRRGTFLLGDPDAKTPRGVASGTITLSSAAQIDDYTLELNSATQASTSNMFRAGDYIQLGGGSAAKLYLVCADVNSDASGDMTVTIEPAVKATVTSGSSIVFTNTAGVFRLTADMNGWDTNVVSNYGITLACREAF